jgi:transketolase
MFSLNKSKNRCRHFRKKILEMSQRVEALHISSAFSSTEIVENIYFNLMKLNKKNQDIFIMSKGHGCLIQYVILEKLKILKKRDIELYCKKDGILGCHPDIQNPGIEASTGSLGHGLGIAVGMCLANKNLNNNKKCFVVLSDGELQEGSTWEAILIASSLKLNNLIVYVDNNNYQSLGKTSETHPSFYPLKDKFKSFGWECFEVNGHNTLELYKSFKMWGEKKPLIIIAKTIKGFPVSFMIDNPIWHYRSPNIQELEKAMTDINKS